MLRLYEEQERQRNLQEEEILRKKDFVLQEKVDVENKKCITKKIPYQDECVRNELQNVSAKNYARFCSDNLRICEESLGKRLSEIKSKVNREEKVRQLLWETSPELRELRKQMLMADVTRDQAMQIAEKQALAELKRQEEESLAAAAEEEKKKYEEELKKKEELEFRAKLKYHKDLDDLRQYRVTKGEKDDETLKKERDAIDEIKKQIEDEDKEIARKKLESQKELYRQAVELQKVREDIKMLEKQNDKSMDLKVDEYRKAHELRRKHLEEEKRLNMEQKLQLQDELLFYLEKMYAEKAQQDLLWTELSIAEREVMEKEKLATVEKKQKILKEELQQLYDMQMYIKKQKEELRKKEEELFRENLLAQLYEEEKLEHMSQQKRRLKQAEHRRIVQDLIEQNRKKKEMEEAREKADLQLLKDREAERNRLVEEERRKFLGEHAKELLGYLPKKVFRDKNEIDRLGEEFKKFYSRKNCSTLYQTDM